LEKRGNTKYPTRAGGFQGPAAHNKRFKLLSASNLRRRGRRMLDAVCRVSEK
jgi:hypothetical protein